MRLKGPIVNMTTDRGVSVLPKEHRDAMATAYANYQGSLRASEATRVKRAQRVARLFLAARKAGWPSNIIGEAVDITGTSVGRIITRHGKDDSGKELTTNRVTPKFPTYIRPERSATPSAGRDKPELRVLTRDEKQELAELAALARTCTGSRPLDHPSRVASTKFSAKIMEYHDAGVTWSILADASGMKISGVRMRATRHGYNSGPPPSIAPYQNIVRQPQRGGQKKRAEEAKASAPTKAKARKVAKRVPVAKASATKTGRSVRAKSA